MQRTKERLATDQSWEGPRAATPRKFVWGMGWDDEERPAFSVGSRARKLKVATCSANLRTGRGRRSESGPFEFDSAGIVL